MRTGKIGRLVVRAVIVGLVAAGAWAAVTIHANAIEWEISPPAPPAEQPDVRLR